jgi:predicted metal-dependent hydrolase
MPTYKDLEYSLIQSGRRKTVSIFIERDGTVLVRAPSTLPVDELEQLLEDKEYWIYRNLAEWRDLNAAQIEREFVNGETFLYLGRNYQLRWVDDQPAALMLKGGHFLLRRDPKTQADPNAVFKNYYRTKGRERIPPRVDYYRTQLGVHVADIRVMELGNRWGSCTAGQQRLSFHWKAMMAPVRVLDYIIVHELAHLLVPDHSPAFWNQVDKILPDHKDRHQWLRNRGAGMGL